MNIKKLAIYTALLFSAWGCSKGIDLVDTPCIVYLPQSGISTQSALLGESEYDLAIYKAGIGKQNKDIVVAISIDPSAFETFKVNNPEYASMEIMPEEFYSIPKKEVSIPMKNEKAQLCIRLKNVTTDFKDKKYVIPVSISHVSDNVTINEDKKIAFLCFNRFRNTFEGKYKAYGLDVSTSDETKKTKIDIDKEFLSFGENSIYGRATTADAGVEIQMVLTIEGKNVVISAAPGYEAFNIKNTSDVSTYEGAFDNVYQRNKGIFKLNYSYVVNENTHHVSEEIKFWL